MPLNNINIFHNNFIAQYANHPTLLATIFTNNNNNLIAFNNLIHYKLLKLTTPREPMKQFS